MATSLVLVDLINISLIREHSFSKKAPASFYKRDDHSSIQCDQMGRLFFDFWPFATRKLCPIAFVLAK